MTETLIDLIRHGQPAGGHRYRGHNVDDPLTEKGWQQMWNAVGDYQAWDQIITSPLQRCRAFADELGKRHDISVQVHTQFKEVGFGIWEGLSHDEIKANQAEAHQAFLKDPVNCRPQGAEVLEDFIQRVGQAYDETMTQYQNKHCLIVAHAGVIRAVIAKIIQIEPVNLYRIKIDNGGITRIRHTESGDLLELLNGRLSPEDD